MSKVKKKQEKHLRDNLLLQDEEESDSYASENTTNSEEEEPDNHRKAFHSSHDTCKCQERYIKIKRSSMKHVIVSKKSCWDADELSMRRQKLEMQLSDSQIEEFMSMDQHNLLQMRLERIENVMEAILLYLDCLQLEARASYRMCQQLNGLIINEKSVVMTESLSQLIKKLCEGTVLQANYPIKDNIMKAMDSTKDLDGLVVDYNERKRDFQTASQNFKLLLENANLNLAQLDKLQRQFDGILLDYQHSRCMLDQELPAIISSRLEVLLDSFSELSADLQKIAADRTDLSSLLRHLEASLRGGNDLAAIKGDLHEAPLVGGALMCSNCSRSPAIAGD